MKSFKDRKDGTRIKDINGMNNIMYHLLKSRCDNEVYVNYSIDITETIKYIEKMNKTNEERHITYFHVFATAIGKVIFNRPYLNRFVVNGHFYDRNEVLLSYVAKTEFTDSAQELMQVVKVNPYDNLFTISDRISKKVKKTRTSSSSGTDDFVEKIGRSPKIVREVVVGLFKFLDKHDMLPSSMTKEIIYYSTVLMSNIGSIGCKEGIYHHLSNFGTNSCLITMGKIYKKEIIDENGKKVVRDFCDFGITLDERIADGFYMIKSIQLLEHIMKNPKLLEDDCSEKLTKE